MSIASKLSQSVLLSLGMASGMMAATSFAQAAVTYDGRWQVTVSAEGESCPARYTVPIKVAGGRVSYNGFFNAQANGKVRNDGALIVTFAHRKDVVNAVGELTGARGTGEWRSPTRECSGTWTARKF